MAGLQEGGRGEVVDLVGLVLGSSLVALALELEGWGPGWVLGQECGRWKGSWDCLEFELLLFVVWGMEVVGVVVWRVWGVWLCLF